MKLKANIKRSATTSKSDLESLADKLKGRDLFPEKTATAKSYLKNAKGSLSGK